MKKRSILLLFITLSFLFKSCTTNKKQNIVTRKQTDSLHMQKNNFDSVKVESEKALVKLKQTKINSDSCDCNAIVYVTKCPENGIELFNKNKKVVNKVSFDEKNEDFIELKLKESDNRMFQIESIRHSFEENVYKKKDYYNLWIDGKHLKVYLPDAKVNVKLYKTPKENAEVVAKVPAYGNYSIKIIKCCKNWIYGIYEEKNGNKYEGWFHPNDICSNPLTNC